MRLLVGLALSLVAILTLPACGRPTAAGEIAFTRERAETIISDVYVIHPDGSGLRRLVSHAEDPAWSPDGRRIAFIRFPKLYAPITDLYVVNADGAGLRRLTRISGYASAHVWSPDGRRIAVVIEGGGIDLLDVDGSGRRRLMPLQADEPSWSPDGRRIAFIRPNGVYHAGASDVYVVNADGSGLRRLTRRSPKSPGSESPAWSPDGRQIAFVNYPDLSTRITRTLFPNEPGDPLGGDIYVINPDGSGRRRLTNGPTQGQGDLDPVWSPDGRQIAFVRESASDVSDIFVVRPDGSGLRRVTQSSDAYGPAWSPDSRRIAFARQEVDNFGIHTADIFVVNADGSGVQRLTETPVREGGLVWSPRM